MTSDGERKAKSGGYRDCFLPELSEVRLPGPRFEYYREKTGRGEERASGFVPIHSRESKEGYCPTNRSLPQFSSSASVVSYLTINTITIRLEGQ